MIINDLFFQIFLCVELTHDYHLPLLMDFLVLLFDYGMSEQIRMSILYGGSKEATQI